MMHKLIAAALTAGLLAAAPALAQAEPKAEITVSNYRAEAITMAFDYVFREYKWNLMRRGIEEDGEIIYRYPSNIPGCERLKAWGIDQGRLTISNAKGDICQKQISICDQTATTMEVRDRVCNWVTN